MVVGARGRRVRLVIVPVVTVFGVLLFFFFSSRRRHTRCSRDWKFRRVLFRSVGKPEIVVRTENGKKLEPLERLVIDVPENFIGIIMETTGSRRGEMIKMSNHGSGRVRMDFKIPSRGLIGLRSQLLTDTRGTALVHSIFEGWMEYGGGHALPPTGALVADRGGPSPAFALWNIQERGELFIGPAIDVYEGMIVGENSREHDIDRKSTREKKQTNMRSSSADEAIRLIPHRELSLEQAIEFIADDEYVEIT